MIDRKKRPTPSPREIALPPTKHQPGKAEHEKGHDMPGASRETVRRAFMRPITVRRELKEK